MNRNLNCVALMLLAAASLSAQARYLQTPWPTGPAFQTGDFEEVVVGRFHARDLGRSAVVRRGGALFVAYQPAHFEHVAATGETGVTAIAAVPRAGRRSLLAIADASGLQLATFDGTVFQRLDVPAAAFANASQVATLRCQSAGGPGVAIAAAVGTNTVVLGWAADGTDAVTVSSTISVPATQIFDVRCLQYDADPAPEVAIVHSGGMQIHDTDASLIASFPAPLSAGWATNWDATPGVAGGESIVAVATVAGVAGIYLAAGATLTPIGTLSSATVPIGLASGDIDGDADQEVVVSTADAESLVLGYRDSSLHPTDAILVPHHTATMSPGTAPATAPPTLVDVDRDGALDLVCADAATDSLITILGFDWEISFVASLPPAEEPATIAISNRPMLWEPATPSVALSGEVHVGIDLSELPAVYGHIQVIAYVHGDPGAAGDSITLTRRSEGLWQRPGIASEGFLAAVIDSHADLDPVLNVPSYNPLSWSGREHYWLEFRPVQLDPVTGDLIDGGESVLYALTVRPDPDAMPGDYGWFLELFADSVPADEIDAVSQNFLSSSGDDIKKRKHIDRRRIGVGRVPKIRPPVGSFVDGTDGSPVLNETMKTDDD